MKKLYWRILILFTVVTACLLGVSITGVIHIQWAQDRGYLEEILTDTQKLLGAGEECYGSSRESTSQDEEGTQEDSRSFIGQMIRNIPTNQTTILVGVDAKTHEIIGITENNMSAQELMDKKGWGRILEKLQKLEEGEMAAIHLSNYFATAAMVRYSPDIFLVGIDTGADSSVEVETNIFRLSASILISYVVIAVFIRLSMKKLFLTDIDKIQNQVLRLLEGNYDTEFEACQSEEIELMVSAIRDLKNGYVHKTERMNKIFNSIGPNIGSFELLDSLQANFFSDNFAKVMGWKKEEVEYYKEHIEEFKGLINELEKKCDKGNIAAFNGKYLEIHMFEIQNELVGVLIDRTEEETEKRRLACNVRDERKKNITDGLTGIMNRKGFQQEVEKILAENHAGGGVLLMCDLDNFKRINDSLGHPEGDRLLKLFSEILKQEFRKSDVVGRIGGDEFMVYLPSDVEDSVLRKKLDHVMDSIRVKLNGYRTYGVSVSIGAAKLDAEMGVVDFESLYESADTALYISKGLGKNRYYINEKGIRCMKSTCEACRINCPRREILALNEGQSNGTVTDRDGNPLHLLPEV